jgi:Na+-transporting NADH:ubiquinone oxidoreductase subunit NqrB
MSFASSVIAPRWPFGTSPAFADARHFQIVTLASLAAIQLTAFDFGASPPQAGVTITASLAVQWLCARLAGTAFDWRSPLITGLSLTLLLRTHSPGLWIAAAVLAIGSKYLLRWRGKHLFNPATFAIVALLVVSPDVWVSPGQWGNAVWLAGLLACCAGLVLQRAERADTALAFLGFYAGLLALRCYFLGDPPTIPLHQLQSGALLLFSFFMITDPRSTPDRRVCRIVFAAAVAALGYWLQFRWQLRTGLFFALFALSPLTPLLDRLLPAPRFAWRSEPPHPSTVEA